MPDHPHCHSTALVVFSLLSHRCQRVYRRNTTCTMIVHVRTAHHRCQAQSVAQDTEQKHGKQEGRPRASGLGIGETNLRDCASPVILSFALHFYRCIKEEQCSVPSTSHIHITMSVDIHAHFRSHLYAQTYMHRLACIGTHACILFFLFSSFFSFFVSLCFPFSLLFFPIFPTCVSNVLPFFAHLFFSLFSHFSLCFSPFLFSFSPFSMFFHFPSFLFFLSFEFFHFFSQNLSLSEEFPPLFSTFSMKCSHHENDLKVTDENDFPSRSMMIKAKNIIVKERIWTGSVTSKIETQPLDTNTDAQLHDERIIAVREEPLR